MSKIDHAKRKRLERSPQAETWNTGTWRTEYPETFPVTVSTFIPQPRRARNTRRNHDQH